MALLAVECATDACSAALLVGGGPGPHRSRPMRRGHAEALMPMVRDIMDEADLAFMDLDAIAVTTGPGAFTGIRVGLAAARGFALAAHLPLVGVTTLEAIAETQDSGGAALLVALDSRRDDVYVQLFAPTGEPLTAPASAMPDSIAALLPAGQPVALAGSAADCVAAVLAGCRPEIRRLAGPDLPDAAAVAQIAARRLAETPRRPGDTPPAALYLRPPDAIPAAARRPGHSR